MKRFRCQQGVAAVEFAIILPLLVTLVFGMIEFSLLLYNQQVITNASREGARAGIVSQQPRVDLTAIQTVVNNYCQNHLVTFASGTVLPTIILGGVGGICTAFGVDLNVTVTYDYTFLVVPNFIPGIPKTKTLSAQTIMRCE
jgi:Flp pilus assembly protein TadG